MFEFEVERGDDGVCSVFDEDEAEVEMGFRGVAELDSGWRVSAGIDNGCRALAEVDSGS
jgi:hypothetical protein